MTYNKRNYYKKIIKIQNRVLEIQRQNPDIFIKEIFYKYIEPEYLISYRTFCEYLGINAKAKIKDLTKK